jgi:pSer/pThr/pTyr-binding forkhead associated (FHA) protein
VGRERDCHVVVEDGSVSRHHADLVPGPQGWILRDLGSSNGTAVNGVRIQGEVLLRGDEALLFGTVKARLEG